MLGADVFDGVGEEGPAEDGDLDDAGPDRGDGLADEHGSRGDLHVLSELEVLREVEALGHGDVAVGFEEHHGEGFAGLDVAGHELARIDVSFEGRNDRRTRIENSIGKRRLREDIEANLYGRHTLDHPNWNEPYKGNSQGKEESPPVQEGRPRKHSCE